MFTKKNLSRPRVPIFFLFLILLLMLIPIPFIFPFPNFPSFAPVQVKYSYERKQKPLPHCSSQGPAKTFLIVFMGNSGSTALSTELLEHPRTHMVTFEHVKDYVGDSDGALAATRKFFEEGVKLGLTPGFKIRPAHIMVAPEKWQQLARDFDTRIIWNYRKNVIKASLTEYVKYVLNDTNNIGGMRKDMTMEDRCKVGQGCTYKVDIEKFHRLVNIGVICNNEITTGVSLLDNGRNCVWEVPYEDYLYHREETVADIQRFLGFEQKPTQPTRIKGTKDNLCDVIENYDELCDRLYGCTLWQPMLEDQLNNCYCRNFVSGASGKLCEITKG